MTRSYRIRLGLELGINLLNCLRNQGAANPFITLSFTCAFHLHYSKLLFCFTEIVNKDYFDLKENSIVVLILSKNPISL